MVYILNLGSDKCIVVSMPKQRPTASTRKGARNSQPCIAKPRRRNVIRDTVSAGAAVVQTLGEGAWSLMTGNLFSDSVSEETKAREQFAERMFDEYRNGRDMCADNLLKPPKHTAHVQTRAMKAVEKQIEQGELWARQRQNDDRPEVTLEQFRIQLKEYEASL